MSKLPVISIVGRPNVGKSTLFNRIIGKRLAVVDDLPGVTRDRNYYKTEWNGQPFILVDTGGVIPTEDNALTAAIWEQVTLAVEESDAVLFLCDATTGVTDTDLHIAKILRRKANKIICVVNKAESKEVEEKFNSFRALGIEEIFLVSALHGNGVADLLDHTIKVAYSQVKEHKNKGILEEPIIKIAIVGRPNAGKSSLINKLLKSKRMVVDSIPGTTRDSIDTVMKYYGKPILLIDTAGLRKKARVKYGIEYYSNLRALESIERCDVAVLMIDVTLGIGIQDLRILQNIVDNKKGVLLVWNKWDLLPKNHKTFDTIVKETKAKYKELQHIPMLAISALSGQRVTNIIKKSLDIKGKMTQRVPPAEFEDKVFSWTRVHPHPAIPENPVRFLGARQVPSSNYPLFRFFVTNPQGVTPLYKRYLTNKIYENYDFEGCPIVLEFHPIKKPKE
ncbi:MAG: ribosome biogenesis GTPase Der [Chitinispirillaceae bacterium]|nr:ribosome biogenesis GTPase Der [Chitinispirillaceae bacterium]